MRHLLIPQTKEQAEEFLRLAEVEASKFGVSRTLPKDVEDFIAGNACSISVKDEYGDTHYDVDSIDVDDLRAWMAGHVRVPVEPTEEMIEAGCKHHECQQQDPWYSNDELSEYDCKAIYKAMINASKEE